jgi:hypothetical protein
MGTSARAEFDELVASLRELKRLDGRTATDHEVSLVIEAFREIHRENERRLAYARERGIPPLNLEELPDLQAIMLELHTEPEPERPTTVIHVHGGVVEVPGPSIKSAGARKRGRRARVGNGTTTVGRGMQKVLVEECNRAGRLYFRHPGDTAYAIWMKYMQGRTADEETLSKHQVYHLCAALDEGWLPWSKRGKGRLLLSGISGEFRASKDRIVIPREAPSD